MNSRGQLVTQGASQQQLVDDAMARFVFCLSEEDKRSHGHYAHLQNAFWFYKDFYAKATNRLPDEQPIESLRDFCAYVWEHYPFLRAAMRPAGLLTFDDYFQDAKAFFHSLSACGVVLLNEARDKVVLVTNTSGDLSFPKGKANLREASYDCAARELQEETGVTLQVKGPGSTGKPMLDPEAYLSLQFKQNTYFKLFLVKDVPEGLAFSPQVRYEIMSVQWYPLAQLQSETKAGNCPGRLRMVMPVIPLLVRWVNQGCPSPSKNEVHLHDQTPGSPPVPEPGRLLQLDKQCRHLFQDSADFYPHLKLAFWYHFFTDTPGLAARYYEAATLINICPGVAVKAHILLLLQQGLFHEASTLLHDHFSLIRTTSSRYDLDALIQLGKMIENQHNLLESETLHPPRTTGMLMVFFKHNHCLFNASDQFTLRAKLHMTPCLTRVLFLYVGRKKGVSGSGASEKGAKYPTAVVSSKKSEDFRDPVVLLEFRAPSARLAALQHLENWGFHVVDLTSAKLEVNRVSFRTFVHNLPLGGGKPVAATGEAPAEDQLPGEEEKLPAFRLNLDLEAIQSRMRSVARAAVEKAMAAQRAVLGEE